MMEETGHIDLFERFRNKEFSESELKAFEARLAYDSEFKQAFEEYQEVENGIKSHFRNELKTKLQELDKKMDSQPQKAPVIRLAVWTSSVAAAIVIGIFIFQHFSTPNHVQLAKEYWPYEEGLPVKMSKKGTYDDAMNAYKLGKYKKAENLLQGIHSDTANYFKGVIAYEIQDFEIAAVRFKQIEKNSSFFDESQFRLAIIYIHQGKLEKGKQILQSLIDNKTDFMNKSKEILTKIT